ncbi:MAG TPA: GGDEF domain-containing protein, partial [Usitatibacter sp.]|nr:GGDEF domain-containing protein [Usitatibacter sp.]
MVPRLRGIFREHRDPDLLDRHRAEGIARRVRMLALLFAVLTLGWTAVDAVAFDRATLERLVALRLAASVAFALLAWHCRPRAATLRQAETCVGLLFAIPALLYLASSHALADVTYAGLAPAVVSLYAFVPFVLAAGIAAFPLTPLESTALATIALLAEGWALAFGTLPSGPLVPLGAFWLLMLIAVVAGFSSLSQLRLLEEVERQAIRDPLTGCHRRESGKELLDLQFVIAARHGTSLSVLFVDLDHFKRVNDSYGHEEGDRVLAAAAAALRHAMRESDIVLRWGGEEFVVVLPHTTKEEAAALLERLALYGIGRLPDGRPVTASVGIAELLADGARSAEELVEIADRRMYRAKQAGRNRYDDGKSVPLQLPSQA